MRFSAASTLSPCPAFTVYFATRTIMSDSLSLRVADYVLTIATARTGAADAPRHLIGSTLTVNE